MSMYTIPIICVKHGYKYEYNQMYLTGNLGWDVVFCLASRVSTAI